LQPTDICFFDFGIGADGSPFQGLKLGFNLTLFML